MILIKEFRELVLKSVQTKLDYSERIRLESDYMINQISWEQHWTVLSSGGWEPIQPVQLLPE